MKILATLSFLSIYFLAFNLSAQENACPQGSYSVVMTPDHATLSILFDQFIVEAGGTSGRTSDFRYCDLNIPLQFPPNMSAGVYKVDYRGFAKLTGKQVSELSVNYALGKHGRNFHRKIKKTEGDYTLSETIGAGLMKRLGCGESAALQVHAVLDLKTNGDAEQAMTTLDSADGTAKGGLIYHFDLKNCH